MVGPRVGAWWWNELTGLNRSASSLKRLRYNYVTSYVTDDTDRALAIAKILSFPNTKSPLGRVFTFQGLQSRKHLDGSRR
jgi:hypothetical protein